MILWKGFTAEGKLSESKIERGHKNLFWTENADGDSLRPEYLSNLFGHFAEATSSIIPLSQESF
jgi:hypothetical protein